MDDVVERATNQDKVATGAQRFIQRFTTGGVGDVDIVRFDVGKIRSELGLNDLGSDRAQALIRALDLAGRADHVAKINEFLSIADLAAQGGIPDVRQFLARHFTLAAGRGGLRRAASVMFGGGLVGTGAGAATSLSVPQALAIVYAGRRFGRFLTDPVALEAATESLRPTASAAVRRSAAARLFRVLPRLFDDEGEERPTSFDVLRELQAQRLTGGLQTGAGIQLSPRELLLQRSQTKGRP